MAVPLTAVSCQSAGAGAQLYGAAAGSRFVNGTEMGKIIKQRGLRKRTECIYWILLSGGSQTWADLG